MAQTTTVVLLPQRAHPGNQGDTFSYFGDGQQAAAYYLANRDLQTITWNVSSTFEGFIKIQASLVTVPGEYDWFEVYDTDAENVNNSFHNLTGNFVWIRAAVSDWTNGTIILSTASY